ncbi:hypothetical protein BKA70DRAFT_1424323 [Coprinopsis sp. MPI-PUGE-AT-0042]|nr:hypothetical protein BKA70DRAFT_1424323 [Coprinopsis sp. MPI-PUGE-AT-0042]
MQNGWIIGSTPDDDEPQEDHNLAADSAAITLGPQVAEDEIVSGSTHIFASFTDDTLVRGTDMAGYEPTLAKAVWNYSPLGFMRRVAAH